MKKNILKNRNFLILSTFIIVSLIIIIVKIFSPNNNPTLNKNGILEFDKNSKEIVLFNKIISESQKLQDFEKCSELKNSDLKSSCISQIKFKFDEMNLASSPKDCEKLKETKDMKKQQRKDVCYLNLNYRLARSSQDKKWCDNIKNQDLKDLCIAQNDQKFSKKIKK